MTSVQPPRKNGLENVSKMFPANKINPEGNKSIRDLSSSTAESMNTAEKVSSIMGRKRWEIQLFKKGRKLFFSTFFSFRNVADVALLYAGSTRGRLDQISLILFPVSFLLFTIIYWVLYLNESRKRALWLELSFLNYLNLKSSNFVYLNLTLRHVVKSNLQPKLIDWKSFCLRKFVTFNNSLSAIIYAERHHKLFKTILN